jgi:hypothetical protein
MPLVVALEEGEEALFWDMVAMLAAVLHREEYTATHFVLRPGLEASRVVSGLALAAEEAVLVDQGQTQASSREKCVANATGAESQVAGLSSVKIRLSDSGNLFYLVIFCKCFVCAC